MAGPMAGPHGRPLWQGPGLAARPALDGTAGTRSSSLRGRTQRRGDQSRVSFGRSIGSNVPGYGPRSVRGSWGAREPRRPLHLRVPRPKLASGREATREPARSRLPLMRNEWVAARHAVCKKGRSRPARATRKRDRPAPAGPTPHTHRIIRDATHSALNGLSTF